MLEQGKTPLELGYTMPAEWQAHDQCWMIWPAREEFWDDLESTMVDYAAVANAIAAFEPVVMAVNSGGAGKAKGYLNENVSLVEIPVDDSWARDSGPSFLTSSGGQLAATSWRFNCWGNKHEPWFDDAQFAERVCGMLDCPVYSSPLVLEGGALHVDGCGSVMVTESVVLNDNRNPGLSKNEATRELKHALGVENVIWLPGDWDEYETDGHIDGLACFVKPGVILHETNPDRSDPHWAVLEENRQALQSARDANGRKYELVEIPEASDAESVGDIYCRSYINYYLPQGGVVAPSYGIDADRGVRELLQSLYPNRRVVMVDIRNIAPGGGGIHCITQQQPARNR